MLTVAKLTCEYLTNPIGLDVRQPRLSWQVHSSQRGARQTAYQIQVNGEPSFAEDATPAMLWDTGKVVSDQSVHIQYEGPALQSGQRCYWRVRAWDENDVMSSWSDIAY